MGQRRGRAAHCDCRVFIQCPAAAASVGGVRWGGARLQGDGGGLAVAAQRGPVQRVAALHIDVVRAAAEHEQQADAVVEAFVRGPVQWRAAVPVARVEGRAPAQHQVEEGGCVAPLRGYVRGLQRARRDQVG